MLIIWTGAKAQDINKTIAPIINGQKGNNPFTTISHLNGHIPLPGDVILAQGTNILKELQANGIAPKGRTVTSLRGKELDYQGTPLLVTYNPGIQTLDYAKFIDMQIDVMLACRRARTGTLAPEMGKYRYVDSFYPILALALKRFEAGEPPLVVSFDLETTGLDEYKPGAWIVSISFTYESGMADVYRFDGPVTPVQPYDQLEGVGILLNQINLILNHPHISTRGANGKFDRRWIKHHWGYNNANYRMDTTLVGSLLDENRSNSLNTHAKIYTTMGGYDDAFNLKYDKGKMADVPPDDLLAYAGGDTDATYRVSNQQLNVLTQDKALTNFYIKLLHPASLAIEKMERVGVLLDVPYYMELQAELQKELSSIQKQAEKLLPRRLLMKHRDNPSLTRAAVINDFMFTKRGLNLTPQMETEKDKKPSTAAAHLAMFSDVPEARQFLGMLQEYNSAAKTLGTYVTGFMKHLRPDGRFHPTGILYRGDYGGTGDSGTVTGRLAFKDPAVQTIPKHTKWAKALRQGYIAPEGYVMVQWDYSQGELKITACVANESKMLQMYKEGIDLHMVTGGKMNGFDLDDMLAMKTEDPAHFTHIRQGGKAGNFGLIYGMGAEGYRLYARDTYGVHMSAEEGHQHRDSFFDLYPALVQWHSDNKALAHADMQMRSPLGRIRHLPLINSYDNSARSKAERQSINSSVQATLSDMTMYSLALFHKHYGSPVGCQPCMTTHDSLCAYVLEDELDIWVPRMRNIMENLPLQTDFGWNHQIPFTTDTEMGLNLAALKELA